jgi:hypothetical protein
MPDWKKIVFALAITLLYIPMVFMAVNTFFPDTPQNTCYAIRPALPERNQTQEYEQSMQELRQCEADYRQLQQQYHGWKFITIMIINIITAGIMITKLDKSIIYGLFFGVVITAFTATIRYMDSHSIPGFILLVILFGIVIYFVNAMRNK